tara:strand:+ start:1668 stop:1838 length:171 start_codon:yes stop_codon:yes gene_type:complete
MAKESKESTLTAGFEYDGVAMTVTQVVPNYDIEDATKALVNLVKLLSQGSTISVTE